jgi:hypothetical protein
LEHGEIARSVSSNVLLLVVQPDPIVKGYLRPLDAGELVCYARPSRSPFWRTGSGPYLAPVFIRRRGIREYRQERLASINPNCGFMAIPLVSALLGRPASSTSSRS